VRSGLSGEDVGLGRYEGRRSVGCAAVVKVEGNVDELVRVFVQMRWTSL
jgi:hypothetical protein